MERGKIYNYDRARQQIDFSGVKINQKITPTDFDAVIEYKDKAYIFIEYKYRDTTMPTGQRIAFERLVDDLNQLKPSVLILASHDTPVEEDIDGAGALVKGVYGSHGYIEKKLWEGKTVKQMLDIFLSFVEK